VRGDNRVRNETLKEEMSVTALIIRSVENRGLRWYGHIERTKEEGLLKNELHWSPQGKGRRGKHAYEHKWETHKVHCRRWRFGGRRLGEQITVEPGGSKPMKEYRQKKNTN
jgi:hypothetical protein